VASSGDEAAIQLLLDNGADIEQRNMWGGRALHVAAYNGHEEVVRLLLDNGEDMRGNKGMGRDSFTITSNIIL
jgi:ankyrin repeat protein